MTNKNQAPSTMVGSEDRGKRGRRAFLHPVPVDPVAFHAVSRVRLDLRRRITDVVWGQIDPEANAWLTDEAFAAVGEVVDALHAGDQVFALFPAEGGHLPERRFAVVMNDDGFETIALDSASAPGRGIDDMDRT